MEEGIEQNYNKKAVSLSHVQENYNIFNGLWVLLFGGVKGC